MIEYHVIEESDANGPWRWQGHEAATMAEAREIVARRRMQIAMWGQPIRVRVRAMPNTL
jgi:hypothetical protein